MQAPVETPLNRASVMHGDVLAEVEVLQRGGELVGLLHAGAHRPAADQHEHIAGLDALPFLMAAMAAFSVMKTRAGPLLR